MNIAKERISWPVLIVGALITLVAALSVHAVMLQGLHVPFPSNFPHAGWARLPDGILSAYGAIYLSAHLPQSIRSRGFALRCALLFLFLATIHEAFFRAPFMEYINLSNFTLYPFLDNGPRLIPIAVVAVGAEAFTSALLPRGKVTLAASLIAAAVLAAFAGLVIAPLANHAFAGVLRFTEAREGNQRYGLPYDWHILLPAYLTFLEPVVAALAIGLAVRRQLPPGQAARFFITAALIVTLKGPVFAPLINVHYADSGPLTAILSSAQFTFETMALGFLTAATLQLALRPARQLS